MSLQPADRAAVTVDRRVVVVAGGTGFLGRRLVAALLAAGSRVLVPTRHPDLDGEVLDGAAPDRAALVHVRSWEQPHEIATAAAERGWRPDAAVAALGGWWIGTELVDLAPDVWRDLLASHLTSHFLAARALAPLVAGGTDPTYVMLNGAASRQPMAGSGPVSVTGAAQTMLLDVLRHEQVGRAVRFHQVTVLAAVAGDERNLDPDATVHHQEVARAVLGVLADPGSPPEVTVG